MRNIFLSAGHSDKVGRDRGASGNGYVEGVLTVEFRDLLEKELKVLGVKVFKDSNDTILAQTIAFFKNLTISNSIVVDTHWNAGTPQATGTEVLVSTISTIFERSLAKEVVEEIAETLGVKNRGVKTEAQSQHKRLGFLHITGENILIEMCFISNANDMKKYQLSKNVLAKNLAKILFNYSLDKVSNDKEYIVVKGDTLTKIAISLGTTVTALESKNKLTTDALKIGQKIKW
jgi:N-acetylmuramoyl-L-alanine amidase